MPIRNSGISDEDGLQNAPAKLVLSAIYIQRSPGIDEKWAILHRSLMWNENCDAKDSMNEKHRDSFKQYAIKLQAEEERVMQYGELKALLDQIVQANTARMELLKKLCYQEDGSFGAVAKEGITTVTGTLAGIYAKMREHSVCRMVRDDIIALDVASVSYGMMLTLGLSIGHEECADLAAELAGRGVKETPSLILALTDLLPIISAGELAADAPLINPAGVQIAGARIRDACNSN